MTLNRLIPLMLVAAMAVMEAYAAAPRRQETPTKDRAGFLLIWTLVALGYGSAFTLWGNPTVAGPGLGPWALWTGVVVALAGMGLRLWSVVTLGRYFTYVVKATADQPVIETGPYRLIRHPSYTGGLLTGIGIGLSLRFALAPVLITAFGLAGYLIRMGIEERTLLAAIGQPYRAYMGRTRRLVPFVW